MDRTLATEVLVINNGILLLVLYILVYENSQIQASNKQFILQCKSNAKLV